MTDLKQTSHSTSPGAVIGAWAALAGLMSLILAAAFDQVAAVWASGLPPAVRTGALVVTALGLSGYMFALLVLAGALALLAARWARHDRVPWLHGLVDRLLGVGLALAASGLVVQAIKHLVGRARPGAGGAHEPFVFHPLGWSNAYTSFPSGHTASAFAVATILGLALPRYRLPVFGVAVAIGVSRVLVGAHYPSDVVAGAALGTAVALGAARARLVARSLQALRRWAFTRATGGAAPSAGGPPPRWARTWPLPALVAGCCAIAWPPADLLGSELAEHVKDGLAVLLALAGVTVRMTLAGLVAPEAGTTTPAATREARGEQDARGVASTGILVALLLMHGNPWTVFLGSALVVIAQAISATAEGRPVRLLPPLDPLIRRWRAAARTSAFDLHRALAAEYPVIALTVIGLALTEFYEQMGKPPEAERLAYAGLLAAIAGGAAIGAAAMWTCRRRTGERQARDGGRT